MSASIAEADREICFDVDGTATYGTLRVPAHREGQRLAAALLLPGSGPTDRNGDVPELDVKPRTLALIAEVLAQQGIISLRFDKYFTGRTGAGAYTKDPGRIDLDAFIRQAAAAYHVLGAQPETRPEALLIAGHSEGGLYALLVAEPERVRPHPAGIALIEPMAEPLLSTIELQATTELSAAIAAGTLDPTVATTNASAVRHAIGEFRAGRPVDTSGLLPGMVRRLRPGLLVAQNARYVRQGDAVHPLAAAAKTKPGTRVLVTAGTRDSNVPVSAIKLLAVVLAGVGTTGPGLQVLPGIDHFLHEAGTPRNEPVLAPAAVAALTQWARPYAAYSPYAAYGLYAAYGALGHGGTVINRKRMTEAREHGGAHLCRRDRPVRFDPAVAPVARASGRALDERVLQHPADRGGLRASQVPDQRHGRRAAVAAARQPLPDAGRDDLRRAANLGDALPRNRPVRADERNPAG
jgi:uncharacterized protein